MKKNNSAKELLQKLGTLLALIILIVIFCAIMPDKFPRVSNIMNILKQASINCLIASGMLCALITAGIDLSVGSNCVLCTCTIGVLMQNFGITNAFLLAICGLSLIHIYVPLSLPAPQNRTGAQSLYVCFTAAGGKGDLPGLRSQTGGKDFPGGGQLFRRLLPRCMQTGGIGKELLEAGHHGCKRCITQSGSGRVVRINPHIISSYSYFFYMN